MRQDACACFEINLSIDLGARLKLNKRMKF
jgi:hypothetical protein